jgi:HK97 family phage portal protein
MTPKDFKYSISMWQLFWGDAYIWFPLSSYNELFILPASSTHPVFDKSGNIWYQTIFPNGKQETLPAVEVMHLMINSADGITGRSVLSFARETIGRQLGAHETQDKILGKGLNPTSVITVNGEVSPDARKKIKDSYIHSVEEDGVAIFDNKITKYESLTLKPIEAQFLETTNATDIEIANFFNFPAYKLNMGKEAYNSNEQQDLDYLKSTLNPYLIGWEQAARINWLSAFEQSTTYFKFNRAALLQTSAKDRSQYLKDQIMSGQLTPNEARKINDESPYEGGDGHYIPANMALVNDDGSLASTTGVSNPPEQPQQE